MARAVAVPVLGGEPRAAVRAHSDRVGPVRVHGTAHHHHQLRRARDGGAPARGRPHAALLRTRMRIPHRLRAQCLSSTYIDSCVQLESELVNDYQSSLCFMVQCARAHRI